MKVLLAGATGAIGRPLVRLLVDAGHEVVALTRTPDKVAEPRRGRRPRRGLRRLRSRRALRDRPETQPDVVLDETTDLPQRYDGRTMNGFFDGMAPLRLHRHAEPHGVPRTRSGRG